MDDKNLIKTLNKLFGKDRSFLREALLEARDNIDIWEKIGCELVKEAAMKDVLGLNWNTFDTLHKPNFDMFSIGDPIYEYSLVLNPGIEKPYDFEKKLVHHCGGSAHICQLWVSLLFDFYAIDIYTMKHVPKANLWEYSPYTPKRSSEKKIISTIKNIMKKRGYKRMTKKLSIQKVPLAITDLCSQGEATVFNCLFSDIRSLQEDIYRTWEYNDPKAYPKIQIRWQERFDLKGRLIERRQYSSYPAGECVVTHFDKNFHVTQFSGYFKNWKKGKAEKVFCVLPTKK